MKKTKYGSSEHSLGVGLVVASALAFSVAGISIMFSTGIGSDRILGDFVALLMTLGNAIYITLVRAFKDCSVVWAGGVSGLQLFCIGWFVSNPIHVSLSDIGLLILFAFSFAVAVILWTEGTKLVTAAESGFFGTVEVPFAILLAWLLLAEIPPTASLIGCGFVLTAVFSHTFYDIAKSG